MGFPDRYDRSSAFFFIFFVLFFYDVFFLVLFFGGMLFFDLILLHLENPNGKHNISANERSKGGGKGKEEEGKGKEEEGKEKGNGELEVRLWQKRKKSLTPQPGIEPGTPAKHNIFCRLPVVYLSTACQKDSHTKYLLF